MTANAARELEATKGRISKMSTVAGPVQSAASAVGDTDNLIGLIDWISSFLKTLEKFNGIVDKIATVSVTLSLRARRCSFDV